MNNKKCELCGLEFDSEDEKEDFENIEENNRCKEISIGQLDIILSDAKKIASENSRANIFYDSKNNRINITFPLPDDLKLVSNLKQYEQ